MSQGSLFPGDSPQPQAVTFAETPSQGPFAGVALENAIDRVLDYSVPPRFRATIAVGQRVRVPLGRGNRPAYGFVVRLRDSSDYPKIKPLLNIDDERVLVDGPLLALSLWISGYYCTPLGTVLESVIPSAVKKRIGLSYVQLAQLAIGREQAQALLEKTRAPRRRAILARLLLLEPEGSIELVRLAGEAGVKIPTVRKLAAVGVIRLINRPDLPALSADVLPAGGGESDIQLNEDQQQVFDALRPRLAGGFSVNLIHGVTGSGKTEIYLQCLRPVIAAGKQAIVLVPEIALTPQTVRRFTARFPNVAVLHSGLSAGERHRQWQSIAAGQAQVVVGARSAIFAPVPNLGIIIVDEEHEASYKQDTAPRYHGRDVAIKRAQLERVPIILGSATPSLETYWRVTEGAGEANGVYQLLTLPRRVRGLQMPHVEVVDMKLQNRIRGHGVHLISQRLEHLLQVTLQAGRQAIVLLNRRGYANFVYCPSCNEPIECKYCDATMTYHRSAAAGVRSASIAKGLHTGQLHCHYCLAVNPLPAACPTCGKLLTLFGLGTQRVEEELSRKFPELAFARVDSDSMRSGQDYEKILARFAKGDLKMLLGTQMIAKGLDYPNVTLVGVISGDTALALPDFRAAERTFQLITQVAGRAGRGDSPGRVVLQTFDPSGPVIQAAIRQDFVGFAQMELKQRKQVGLPPYARMARIILRDQEPEALQRHCERLALKLSEQVAKVNSGPPPHVAVKGPMPCAISRIAGYYRNQVVMTCARSGPIQEILRALREAGKLAKPERIAVDVDPVSLL